MFYQAVAPGNLGHGVRFVDAAAPVARQGYAGYFFDAGMDFTGSVQQVKDLLAQHGLKAAGFGLPLEFRKGEAEYRQGMESLPAALEFARALGITGCTTWIMPAHEELNFDENFALHQRRLAPAARMMADYGITFGMEYVGPKKLRKKARYSFIHDLDGMLSLCEALGSGNCGLMLDAWHWHLAGQTFEDFRKVSKPGQVVCVHVMDAPANIPDEEQEDLVRRLPGTTGVINIAEFFAGLKLIGYEGPVLVEPFERFLAQIPFEEALKVVKKALNSVWPEPVS